MMTTCTATSNTPTTSTATTSTASIPLVVCNSRRETRSSTGVAVNSMYMKSNTPHGSPEKEMPKIPPVDPESPDSISSDITVIEKTLWDKVLEQEKTISNMAKIIDDHTKYIVSTGKRVTELEWELTLLKAKSAVNENVAEGLQKEVARLQQYTRRYSVTIAGVKKPANEKPEDLKNIVEEIVNETDSPVAAEDIDKFHRNGPYKEGYQDIIIRMKSHSAKEALYKARKSLPDSKKYVKIRPSLGPFQKQLLHDANETVKYLQNENMLNPPDFVMADVHGNMQIKFKNKTTKQKSKKSGMFVKFDSIKQLSNIIAQEQSVDYTDDLYNYDQEWDQTLESSLAEYFTSDVTYPAT